MRLGVGEPSPRPLRRNHLWEKWAGLTLRSRDGSKGPETSCPSGSGCFLPEWPHPPASRAKSERRRDADPISAEGREQLCVNSLISHLQPILLNAPSKSLCWGGLGPKANTPTGVHGEADVCRSPGPASTAQPHSLFIFPVQSSGSSPRCVCRPSNALLIATLRLPSRKLL